MAEIKMRLEDWLDDLCVRFIINLPQEDLSSVARICFQVEEAQWFYEDFIRPLDPTLPSMSLRSFCLRIFQHCPLLASFSVENHMRAFEEFLQYKTRVPVRGAILLNETMDSAVLVKGWKKGANWSFPRGKINKDEDDLDCAIREVYEEIGFDIRAAGLVPSPEEVKYIEITMREQQVRLYVFRNIPMDTHFEPKTRKEISKIEWYSLSELPAFRKKGNQQHNDTAAAANANKFYMVAPFLVPLKKWVVQQKKKDVHRNNSMHLASQPLHEEFLTEDDMGTHTEPVVDPARNPPPIDTLEGATRELQRLLKVQPPTHGLQPVPQRVPSSDKGGALLALLQAKNAGQLPQAPGNVRNGTQYSHTPLDAFQNIAPEAQTPPHYRSTQQAPPLISCPAPATFPIPSNINPNSVNTTYGQPYSQLLQQLHGSQGQVQNQGARTVAPPQQQPIPLLHPQPLPPQVQSSLRQFSSPSIPEPVLNKAPASLAAQLGGFQPMVPQAKQPLNSHSMALLNAFKSDAPRTGDARAAPTAARSQPQPAAWPTTTSSLQQALTATATGLSPSSADSPSQPSLRAARHGMPSGPSNGGMSRHGSGQDLPPFRAEYHSGRQNVPHHPTSGVEAVQAVSQAVGAPAQMNPDLNLPFGAHSIMSRPKGQEAQPNRDVPMHHQAAAGRVGPPNLQGRPVAQAYPAMRSPEEKPPQPPSHLENVQPMAAGQQRPVPAQQPPQQPPQQHQQQHAGLPYGAQAYNASGAAAGVFQRRHGASSGDKQKLLSLFKPARAPTPTAAPPAAATKKPAVTGQSPIMYGYVPPPPGSGGQQRSRVASLASANGEPGVGAGAAGAGARSPSGSRRGSQTPISPADRSFLLEYLQAQSVPNAAAR